MPKRPLEQTSLYTYFNKESSAQSSQSSKSSRSRQLRTPRPRHGTQEGRVEVKTKTDAGYKESRTEASSLKVSREVCEISDDDASATRFQGKGKGRQDGMSIRTASRSPWSPNVDPNPSTPTGLRRGLLIDLTHSPNPKRGSGNQHSLPTPPATGMKRTNVAVSSSLHPDPPEMKRARRGTFASEAPEATPVPSFHLNAAALVTPITNPRPARTVPAEPSSPLSSMSFAPQKHADSFLTVAPLSPSRRHQVLLDESCPMSEGNQAPLFFKVPAPPSTPRQRRLSSDSVVESSQVEEQNPFCPETPRHRGADRLNIGSMGKNTVATSQSSEMELRIPSSPAAPKTPSRLRLDTHGLPKPQPHFLHRGHQASSPVTLISPDEVVPTSQFTLEKELSSTPHMNRWPCTPLSKSIARSSQAQSPTSEHNEIAPDTPSRGRRSERSPRTPRSHKRFSSPAAIRGCGASSKTPMRSLGLYPFSPGDNAGSAQRAHEQYEGLFESQEQNGPGKLLPVPCSGGQASQYPCDSPHSHAAFENLFPVFDSSQTEDESLGHRVPTQGESKHVEPSSSQTEPESLPVVNRSQVHTKAPVESSQTQPESPQWLVPTQNKLPPVDESQTQSESPGHTVKTQGPLFTSQNATSQRRSGILDHGSEPQSRSVGPTVASIAEERDLWADTESRRDRVPLENRSERNSVKRRLRTVLEHVLANNVDTDGEDDFPIGDEPLSIPSDFESSQTQSQSQYLGSSSLPTQVKRFRDMFPDDD